MPDTGQSVPKLVLILGGGINGAALARELLLNRVHVVLVDTADLASGATAYSSRLIHGGLRYLEYGEFDLVRESLTERSRLLKLAPQFVRPLRLFIPVERRWGGLLASALRFVGWKGKPARADRARGLWLIRAGLWLYDRYAKDAGLPRRAIHRVGSAKTPPVDSQTYRWLCAYHDAQVIYPERFVMALFADARQIAAESRLQFDVYTYHRVKLSDGRVHIAPVAPSGSGTRESSVPETLGSLTTSATLQIEPAAIVNATGAWVDLTLAGLAIPERRLMAGTKGSHFVTSHSGLRESLSGDGIYAEAADGRPFFILPLGSATLVGTTDLPFDGEPGSAVATEDELAYLLTGVNRVLPQVNLTRADIDFHYSGVRPLPHVGSGTPAAVTRRHWLEEHKDCEIPTFSVIGGKLTTCRSLAEEATHTIFTRLGHSPLASSRERILPGAEAFPPNPQSLDTAQRQLAEQTQLTPEQVRAVWPLCGTGSKHWLTGVDGSPFTPSERASISGSNLPRGFVRRIIQEEWAWHLVDLVERRLMLLYHRQLSVQTLQDLAQLLADERRIAPHEVEAELEACITRLKTKYGKQVERP